MDAIDALKRIQLIESSFSEDILALPKHAWPLWRQCIWISLLQADCAAQVSSQDSGSRGYNFAKHSALKSAIRIYNEYMIGTLQGIIALPSSIRRLLFLRPQVLLFSRSTYLETLPSGQCFDRIVDPIMFVAKQHLPCAKLYFGDVRPRADYYLQPLNAPRLLSALLRLLSLKNGLLCYKRELRRELNSLVSLLSKVMYLMPEIEPQALHHQLQSAFRTFYLWRDVGRCLLMAAPTVRRIFVACWYFPDAMGLIAAAHEKGVCSIDVQHGKQGPYQGMYSGWSLIPNTGYASMPSAFWCWGRTSCDHILSASPDRASHRPFVGGYAWPAWYKSFVAFPASSPSDAPPCRLLFTLQPPVSSEDDPIPAALLAYLKTSPQGVHIRFRNHPNYQEGYRLIRSALMDFPASAVSVSPSGSPLPVDLTWCTHHLTLYSSCCLEATLYGAASAVIGSQAAATYHEQIKSGQLSWSSTLSVDWLKRWLLTRASAHLLTPNRWIDVVMPSVHNVLVQK